MSRKLDYDAENADFELGDTVTFDHEGIRLTGEVTEGGRIKPTVLELALAMRREHDAQCPPNNPMGGCRCVPCVIARAYIETQQPKEPTSADKPIKLSLGGGYKTRDGHNAIIMRITDNEYYAYGAVMLKSGLRESVWRAETGGRVYSKAPKHNRHDIVSREAV